MLKSLSKEARQGLIFVVIVAGLAHLPFSWAGYHWTDYGFILANSRRLLDGLIPHRDSLLSG